MWLGAQGLVNALFFTFRGSTAAAVTVAGLFAGAGAVFHFLGKLVHPVFTAIYNCLLTTPMDLMSMCWTDPEFTARCVLTGGGWFLAATVVGLVIFHRREIN